MDNIVIVSGAQQSDSAIHIHVSILPQTPLPSRLPHNIEQSSLCYTVGTCWLFSKAMSFSSSTLFRPQFHLPGEPKCDGKCKFSSSELAVY